MNTFTLKRPVVMLVDDNIANLGIAKNMLKEFYEVYALPSAERMFAFLKSVTPRLILLDVEMPGLSGFDALKILKADTRYAKIPVIFVTAKTDEQDELEGFALGAIDYVTKPFSAAILLKRIENHLLIEDQKAELNYLNNNLVKIVEEQTARITKSQNSMIDTFAEFVEFRDTATGGHIRRTQQYMELLVDRIVTRGIYTETVRQWDNMEYIGASAKLHDLGKLFISDNILNKPGKLTAEEYKVMQTHVARGVETIQKMKKNSKTWEFLRYAEIMIGTHHEKWDGSGYPVGLKEQNIPLLGRLMAIADVYDALTSARPYKDALSAREAERIIIESSGIHFDPVIVGVFRESKKEFYAIANRSGYTCHKKNIC